MQMSTSIYLLATIIVATINCTTAMADLKSYRETTTKETKTKETKTKTKTKTKDIRTRETTNTVITNKESTTNETKTYKCPPPDKLDEILCQAALEDNDALSFAEPVLPESQQLDIRPGNCFSFFDDYLHTRRGLRIESALKQSLFYKKYESTVSTFPVIDFIDNGVARVVKTRDLASDSFNNPNNENALFDQIMNDAKDINERFFNILESEGSISATSNGKTTKIVMGNVKEIFLDIVVQTGMASASHTSQIKRAKDEILRRWGYRLQLVEIP